MIDANVMLAPYRFQARARDELFAVLEKLGKRLWIPHQVGLEFHRNRLNVMHEQEEYFDKAGEQIVARLNDYLGAVKSFAHRVGLSQSTVKDLEEEILKAHSAVMMGEFTHAATSNDICLNGYVSDVVLARLENLLDDRVGKPMEPGELETAKKEAKRRVDAKIPPGYKDKDKPDPTGDYLVWVQLKAEAMARKLPVVLITDDRKEDWYRREHGLTLGARWELREEMMAEAGVMFLTMTTATFLHQAEKYLNAEVSPETITQARELPGDEYTIVVCAPLVVAAIDALLERLRDNLAFGGAIMDGFESLNIGDQTLLLSLLLHEEDAVLRKRHEDDAPGNSPPVVVASKDATTDIIRELMAGVSRSEITAEDVERARTAIKAMLAGDLEP